MKVITTIVVLLFIAGSAVSCNSQSQNSEQAVADSTRKKNVDENPYTDLRNIALSSTAEQIGVELPAGKGIKVYGFVMDMDLGEGTATLASFLSGDASLYLSTGGGLIGGREHDNVSNATEVLIAKAGKYLSKAEKTTTTPLPSKDGVNFYFLTDQGIYRGQEDIANLKSKSSEWLDLFAEANKVIGEIGKIENKKK